MLHLDVDRLKEIASSGGKTPSGYRKNSVVRAIKILKILNRDNFKCVECGSSEKLTIDHTRGRKFAKWDNAKKYKLNKCRTLCEDCHIKKNEKPKRRKRIYKDCIE